MTNLFKLYSNCILGSDWQYYPLSSTGIEVLSDAEVGKGFITSYLGKGCKNELKMFEYIHNLSDIRIRHIVSCFFLGVAIYYKCSKIQDSINALLSTTHANPKETTEERFLYVWMLICLFHDLGYVVENGLALLKKNEFDDLMKMFPKRPKYIPKLFNKTLLKNYNKFRLCRFGVNDHGIVGGIKLYKDLCGLREVKEKEDSSHFWGKSLENDFCLAAWTIACHNVFMAKKGNQNEKCYTCINLSSLIYNNQSREINLKDHSLLFLFCLIDTIESLKIIHNFNLLKIISLEISTQSIIIDYSNLCQVMKEEWEKKLKDLNEWLTNVKSSNLGKMIIEIL